MAIDAHLIIAEAEQLYRLTLSVGRAEELAAEIERLNASTAAMTSLLELEDEPQRYLAALPDLAERRDRSRG